MGFYESLEKIRQQPVYARRRLAFLLSATVTLFIFVLWVANMFLINGFEARVASEQTNQVESTVATSSTPQSEVIVQSGFEVQMERIKRGGEKVISVISDLFK